jgi:hypothetical protein
VKSDSGSLLDGFDWVIVIDLRQVDNSVPRRRCADGAFNGTEERSQPFDAGS